eukprot:749436-Hanusia_phi.AAC.1
MRLSGRTLLLCLCLLANFAHVSSMDYDDEEEEDHNSKTRERRFRWGKYRHRSALRFCAPGDGNTNDSRLCSGDVLGRPVPHAAQAHRDVTTAVEPEGLRLVVGLESDAGRREAAGDREGGRLVHHLRRDDVSGVRGRHAVVIKVGKGETDPHGQIKVDVYYKRNELKVGCHARSIE